MHSLPNKKKNKKNVRVFFALEITKQNKFQQIIGNDTFFLHRKFLIVQGHCLK